MGLIVERERERRKGGEAAIISLCRGLRLARSIDGRRGENRRGGKTATMSGARLERVEEAEGGGGELGDEKFDKQLSTCLIEPPWKSG